MQDNCGAFLVDLESRERTRTGIASLKVEYNRVHGFYIEVTHAHVEKIPDDYRRRQTLKNAERYITPELKAFEDKALSAQERALAREKYLYDALLAELVPAIPALQRAAHALAMLDVMSSHAIAAQELGWTQPVLSAEPGIQIRGGRHPVVETQVEAFIANDLTLDPTRRLLIVTGPNMGGKSTYMRQAAVIVLLAYSGLFVPAASARLGPVDAIYTRIGAADDLAGGRSTFMVEMTEAAYILNRATPQSLVLIDEIGRGTSTFDGLALAWAIARELALTNRSLALFATHYFELTALPHELEGCANVHFDAAEHKNGIVFLHAVEDGPANQSYGLQVAKLAGVPAEALRQARCVSGAARSIQRATRRPGRFVCGRRPDRPLPNVPTRPCSTGSWRSTRTRCHQGMRMPRCTNSSAWPNAGRAERSRTLSDGGRRVRARARAPSPPARQAARRAPCSRSASADRQAGGCRPPPPCHRRYRSPCTRVDRRRRHRPGRCLARHSLRTAFRP